MATETIKSDTIEHESQSADMGKAIEASINDVQKTVAKAGDTMFVWLSKVPLASLGLVGMISDEVQAVANKFYLNKLIERGEAVQKDTEKWLQDMQARFR
ncbi:hypothetical protein K2Z83_01035 [Oscillochloris sp. ZM17-4]|uniref:hypothetical protein n=1 Tax=Oscillochloris sp. ZM17-4 TaxID=2866714 RepID=UPI001C732AAF|nr:hypothetical protein [Oscillochloris sp. ZM17-4]MBX0326278.1 hypothetical protein [Oscillochloris sp. ZM17-4]